MENTTKVITFFQNIPQFFKLCVFISIFTKYKKLKYFLNHTLFFVLNYNTNKQGSDNITDNIKSALNFHIFQTIKHINIKVNHES